MELKQQCSRVLMVEPTHFGFNPQTANSNAFQQKIDLNSKQIQQQAIAEFREFVIQLEAVGIEIHSFKSSANEQLLDAVFPNNWISLHADGTLILYPMLAKNRRAERNPKIIHYLQKVFDIKRIKDFSSREEQKEIVEGTGSIVFDHLHRIAFACLSERTTLPLFYEICTYLNYRPVPFNAYDERGKEIYHTNVMMALGEAYALICLESISNEKERRLIVNTLETTGHELIPISFDQIKAFAGNALELLNNKGERYLVISQSAFAVLKPHQIETIEKTAHLLPINISTIEHIGGGSVRCMLAEIFCPLRS